MIATRLRGMFVAVQALGALLAAAPLAAQAGNLVPSGRFDDAADVAAWFHPFADSAIEHEPFQDDDFCPASGSARAFSTVDTDDEVVFFYVCVSSVDDDQPYRLSASLWFETGVVDGWAQVFPLFQNGLACTGDTVASPGFFVGPANATVSNWQRLTTVANAPHGAVSAQIRIQLVKELATDLELQLLVDEIYFGPASYLFADDFEVGLDCRWSVSTNDL